MEVFSSSCTANKGSYCIELPLLAVPTYKGGTYALAIPRENQLLVDSPNGGLC